MEVEDNILKEDVAFEQIEITPIEEAFLSELVAKPYELHQINLSLSDRMYLELVEGQDAIYYWGATTTGALIPKGRNFDIWRDKVGREKAIEIFRGRSVYGTFMHSEFANWWIHGARPNKQIQNDLKLRMASEGINLNLWTEGYFGKIGWREEILKDMFAHSKWALDYEIEPIAIELALRSQTYGVASRLDIIHWCNDKNYKSTKREKRGRHLAYTDWKSGKSGFYKENVTQANFSMRIWNENFHDMQVSNCYNFAPSEFRTNSEKPYVFKDQTGRCSEDRLLALSMLGKEEMLPMLTKKRLLMPTQFNKGANPNDEVIETTIDEVIKSGKWENYVIKPEELLALDV